MAFKALKKTNKFLWKYKYRLLLGIVFVSVANVFAIFPAQAVRNVIDLISGTLHVYFIHQGTSAQPLINEIFTNTVMIYGILILSFAVLRGLFMFLMRQTIIVMSRLIEYDQKNQIYAHYQTLPLSFYRKNNTGDLMARISEDVSKVRMYYGPAIMYLINLLSTSFLVIASMLAIDISLTLWVLLPLPFLSVSIYFVNQTIEFRSTKIQQQLSTLSTFVQESFSGIRIIKAFAREEDSVKNFSTESQIYHDRSLNLTKINAVFSPLIMTLVGLSILIVIYVGGQKVMEGKISAGNIAEFIMYVTMLTWPFTSLGWVSSIIQRAEASQKRINEFLDTHTDLISEQNIQTPIQGAIQFKNVSLLYHDTGIKALENLHFSINKGESLAILGNTGSGKSTIANLLLRLMDPTTGEILLDNRPLSAYDLGYIRSQIGYVPQDVFLFSESIEANIAFGADQLTGKQIFQAALYADMAQTIEQMPQGMQTLIGERGLTLSGGQKQRLSIARALVKDPQILVLDDCLSAVDTYTEHTILTNLAQIMKGKTTIIISHRVSSAKLADHILFLEGGKVAEYGTHEHLLQRGGKYKELYEKQLQSDEKVQI